MELEGPRVCSCMRQPIWCSVGQRLRSNTGFDGPSVWSNSTALNVLITTGCTTTFCHSGIVWGSWETTCNFELLTMLRTPQAFQQLTKSSALSSSSILLSHGFCTAWGVGIEESLGCHIFCHAFLCKYMGEEWRMLLLKIRWEFSHNHSRIGAVKYIHFECFHFEAHNKSMRMSWHWRDWLGDSRAW